LSFFEGDVIAKEQLPGAVGTAVGPAVVSGGDSRHYYYDKKRRKEDELFSMIKELLMEIS